MCTWAELKPSSWGRLAEAVALDTYAELNRTVLGKVLLGVLSPGLCWHGEQNQLIWSTGRGKSWAKGRWKSAVEMTEREGLKLQGKKPHHLPRHGRRGGHTSPAAFRGNSHFYFTYLLTCLFYRTEIEPQASHMLGNHSSTELNIHSFLTLFFYEAESH